MAKPRPLVLTILDGWGFSPALEGNAIAAANKPVYDRLLREYPNTLVHTSGPYVGLPEGQMGNSEVGHLNIGAGRVVYMDVTRIDMMISSGEFFSHPVLVDAMKRARGSHLHLFGLLSNGGVHSQNTHLYALLRMAKEQGVSEVFVHCFMDGRDTPPKAAQASSKNCSVRCAEYRRRARSRRSSGRYYAMDRDKRWERIERAFNAMVLGEGEKATDPVAAVRRSYERGVTDEFIEPIVIVDERNEPVGLIRDDDVCIIYNYRADRAREITMALMDKSLEQPSRSLVPKNLLYVMMTQYDKSFDLPYVLPPEHPNNILANVMAQLNWKNLRVAETEKYAHVTYFFNGGAEKPFPGEEREMVPSPKVATYDLKPEMSADGVADVVIERDRQGRFRRDRDELRERRHGRPLGQDGADGARRSKPSTPAWAASTQRCGRRAALDHHRRSRQRRDDDRPGDQGSAHLSHDESGPVRVCRRGAMAAAAEWRAAGHLTHDSGRARRGAAERDEGPRSADHPLG